MLTPHMSLGIAQTVFYIPALFLAIALFHRNFKYHPRMAWWPFVSLTVLRLAGGIVTIILEKQLQKNPNKPNIGLIIAAIILLNVGIVPLVIATLGQMRIVLLDNYSENPRTAKIAKILRISYLNAIILLTVGGGLFDTNATVAKALMLVGYAVFAIEVAILIVMEVYYFRRRDEMIASSRRVLVASLIAAPFLIVRVIYGILGAINMFDITSTWNPLFGNIYVFTFMVLVAEYIVMCIYFILGYSMPADRGVRRLP